MAQVNKIDSNITGLAYAEEVSLGVLPDYTSATFATGWMTLADLPTEDDSVTIGNETYVFRDTFDTNTNEVIIGATIQDTLDNLAVAINEGETALIVGAGTVANTEVSAVSEAGILRLTALDEGAAGNAVDTIEVVDDGGVIAFQAATLLGGVDSVGNPPEWRRLEPNSYSDFGGELTTVAPNPINPSRQRKKGVVTDLDASGGFNHNLTYHNLTDLLQAVFFADIRRKGREAVTAVDVDAGNPDEYEVADTSGFVVGSLIKGNGFTAVANNALNVVTAVVPNVSVEVADGQLVAEAAPPAGAYIQVVGVRSSVGDIDVDVTGDLPKLISSTLDFTSLGLVVGQWIFIGGDSAANRFTKAVNNGFKRIRKIEQNALTLDKSVGAMENEAQADKLIDIYFGDVLRNETGGAIRRRSYHIERTLGAPDSAAPGQIQSEYLKGAIPNEFTINIPTANLVNVDFTFVSIDHQQRTGTEGPLQTAVKNPEKAEVYNTSSDFSRIKMSSVSDTDEAPTPLFAFITEATITINNNLSPNKAVGVLGAFDVTAGTFAVSGSVTAYFGNVAAVQAVRSNADITLDMAIVKNNTGIIIDIPLVALGDGRLNVEQDQPITLPLSMDAATAEDIATGMDHTALLTFFGYLPNLAE